jgi:thioredoxin reductase (NADPH)
MTTPHDFRDLTLVGAGPTGLFGAFYAGMRGASVRLVDALPELGGQATVDQVRRLCAEDKMELRTFWEVKAIHGDTAVRAVTIVNTKTRAEERVAVDAVIPLLGFVSKLGDIANWGLTLANDEIVVDQRMETNVPGIWAAGDVVTYPGKLKLIATGFGEVCTAVNNAVHFVHPDKKVFPGHSSNMEGLFAVGA